MGCGPRFPLVLVVFGGLRFAFGMILFVTEQFFYVLGRGASRPLHFQSPFGSVPTF